MKTSFRPTNTATLVLITMTSLLLLTSCGTSASPGPSEESGPSLATQDQALTGSEDEQPGGGDSASDGQGEQGVEGAGKQLPVLMCPIGEDAQDDRAALEVKYDLTWAPPQGPKISLDQTFTFTASYAPTSDPSTDQLTGELTFENLGPRTATFKIEWPECMKDNKEISYNFNFTPTVTGTCQGGVISIDYTEKWQSGQFSIPCEKGSRICGDDDDCKPVPWYMPFGMGAAGTVTRTFTIDKDFTVDPPSHPVPFLGAGGSGERTIQLEWLP